jgi:hypothetical protein
MMIYNYTHLLFQLFARILFFYCGIIRQKMIQVIHLWPICKMHQYLLVMLETSRKDRDIIMLCYFVCHCPHQRYYNMPIATPGYPSNTTSALTPPIGKSTSLVFDSYFRPGFVQGGEVWIQLLENYDLSISQEPVSYSGQR